MMLSPKFAITLTFDFAYPISEQQLGEALLRAVATPQFGIPGVMTIGPIEAIGSAAIVQTSTQRRTPTGGRGQ